MLETIETQNYVIFDPKVQSHMQAYYSIHYRGKQTELRFKLERPFKDVISMMHHKIAQEFLKQSFAGPQLDFSY